MSVIWRNISRWLNKTHDNCTAEEMKEAARNHFSVEFALTRRDVDTKIVGNTVRKLWE